MQIELLIEFPVRTGQPERPGTMECIFTGLGINGCAPVGRTLKMNEKLAQPM
jgi:hypothetical protein